MPLPLPPAPFPIAEVHPRAQPVMLAAARYVLRDAADAEDAVQDAWLALLRWAPKFRGDADPRTVCYAAARSRALMALRHAGTRGREVPLPAEELLPASAAPGPDAALAAREARAERRRRWLRLYAAAPPAQRFWLRQLLAHGSAARAAAALGVPAATVRAALRRLRLLAEREGI